MTAAGRAVPAPPRSDAARAWQRAWAQGRAGLRALAAMALPQACALCSASTGEHVVCEPCMNQLPPLPPACPVCAQPAPGASICGACLHRPPAFDATLAACAYAFPLDRLVQGLKYEHRLALAVPLGDLLAAAILRAPASRPRPDILIALPLAPARQRERGFNQAVEIARTVSRRTALPLASGLVRTGSAPPQVGLPWPQRRRNVAGAFHALASFQGQSIALIDDVMTTGATLDAAATALKRAGASRIEAWVVARTIAAPAS